MVFFKKSVLIPLDGAGKSGEPRQDAQEFPSPFIEPGRREEKRGGRGRKISRKKRKKYRGMPSLVPKRWGKAEKSFFVRAKCDHKER